jgi:hypothetical protein
MNSKYELLLDEFVEYLATKLFSSGEETGGGE